MELRDYVEQLADIKARKVEITREEKDLNTEQAETEDNIARILLNRGEDKSSIQGVGTVSVSIHHYPKVANELKFFEYLASINQDGMIKRVVPSQTLRAWFKDQVFDKKIEVIGLEDFTKTKINFRRR